MSNETDKELLELAAKAAGVEVTHYVFGKGLSLANPKEGMQILPRVWNPLTDDADALRLAVKLSMTIDIGRAWVGVAYPVDCSELGSEHGGDVCAATRRAIVRAAAEIGRGME